MHAFDDEVSYTRIIDPEPAGEDLVIPAKGERPSLVWRPRLGEDQTYELSGRLTKLGRHDENDVVLAGPTVSARHATVRVEPIGVVLEDEGSLNGTFVNKKRVEAADLENGDELQIGKYRLTYLR
jgi:pSer/pThr/pTyr-binding forkhead associated (FHA) protein